MAGEHSALGPGGAALEEAAEWLMLLSAGDATVEQTAAWQAWRSSSAERERAWQRAESLMGKLGGLPPALSMSVLDRPHDPGRRRLIRQLAVLLAIAPAGWLGWRVSEQQGWTADYRSAVGQRRELTLAEGTQVILNTDSAIDVRFDANERFIRLLRGEILVQTAADNRVPSRPLRVSTEEGLMQALGTRFTVRERAGRTYLAVLDGAVRVHPGKAAARVVNAGERADFDQRSLGPSTALDSASTYWTQGMLLADNMTLADLIAELGRYQRGVLRCDPRIADVRVSGAFPISDRRRTLDMLQSTYALNIEEHMGGYWTLISSR